MHTPVLLKETLKYLNPKSGENFIDCTFGFGGHALAILGHIMPAGKILGIERDKEVLEKFEPQENIILVHENFVNLKKIVEQNNFRPISGIFFDLGLSSWQIEKSGRGFTFQKNEPLDMRSDPINNKLTAEDIINSWSKQELFKIFQDYGGERYARQFAEKICLARQKEKIATTERLIEIIKQAMPKHYLSSKIHFATRVFQALRITVNDELNNFKKALPQALEVLEPSGRLAVISFHSLEDKIVKNFFKEMSKEKQLEILTKKPVRPSWEEVKLNPRSRSAKLRVAVKH